MGSPVFPDYSFPYPLSYAITLIIYYLYPEISFCVEYYALLICVLINPLIRGNGDKAVNNTHRNPSPCEVSILAWGGEEIKKHKIVK